MSTNPAAEFARVYGNPAHPNYLADPFVFRHQDVFYAVGTGGQSSTSQTGRIFPMLRSEDFVTWVSIGHALAAPEVELGTDYWAPEIAEVNGQFFLYYSVGVSDKNHQLRVATASNPTGPYHDTGEPVLDPKSCCFAIDPNPFKDANGNWWLFYARDLFDGPRPGTSLVMSPLIDMRRTPDEYVEVARAHHDWQRFQNPRTMYGEVYDWHTLEGPCMVRYEDTYYCLYSGGNWNNESYGLDYVYSKNITGPYIDDNPGDLPRILRTVPEKVVGPGHNSVVLGPNGVTQYLAYHAWDARKVARRMCFDVLDWHEGKPHCDGPTWEPKIVDW